MNFKLEIYRDGEYQQDDILIDTHNEVIVRYSNSSAVAIIGSTEVATMYTFDDDPIEIRDNAIIISGVVSPKNENPYGYWKLMPLL